MTKVEPEQTSSNAARFPPPLWSVLYTRPDTRDGSEALDQVLLGAPGPNTFYIDWYGESGDDIIRDFGREDVFVTNAPLHDLAGSEVFDLTYEGIDLNGQMPTTDSVVFSDEEKLKGLRFIGEQEMLFVYGAAAARPPNAIEGYSAVGFSRDVLRGTAGLDLFYFDNALKLNLGSDVIRGFDSGDRIITTAPLLDLNGGDRIRADTSDRFSLHDISATGPYSGFGILKVFASNDKAVSTLVLEKTVESELGPYYVYARAGDLTPGADISI